MFSIDDTIVAVATPAGHGGIGVVRLSGPRAAAIGAALASRTRPWSVRRVTRARVESDGVDADALVTYFQGPSSYTGDDVIEIAAHGNPLLLAGIVQAAVRHGARAARRGEFTMRAYLQGKVDLVQAEAVRDLVDAVSPAQARAAVDHLDGTLSTAIASLVTELRRIETLLEASLDFPDEGYRFIDGEAVARGIDDARRRVGSMLGGESRASLVREGARVAIAGLPNVGKSSVFNALIGADRAIVTAVPGTTRDLVSERVTIEGHLALLVDTAGLRDTTDLIEGEGIRRAEQALTSAHVVVMILDRSRPLLAGEGALLKRVDAARRIVVANKCDLPPAWSVADVGAAALEISARTGTGVAALAAAIAATIDRAGGPLEDVTLINARQRGLLEVARVALDRVSAEIASSGGTLPEEFVVADVRTALQALEDVVGRRSADALLEEIFSTFCIGK